MVLAELLDVISDYAKILIMTSDEYEPFWGHKHFFSEALESDEESPELRERLMNCLDKEVREIYWQKGCNYIEIDINALKEEITPECQEPDSDCRP